MNVRGLSVRGWPGADRNHGGADMAQVRSWVGLDVHRASVVAATMDRVSGEMRVRRLPGETSEVVAFCVGLPGPTKVAYEAGPTGFGLSRALTAAGVQCVIAAPGKIARPSGDRVKTDQPCATRGRTNVSERVDGGSPFGEGVVPGSCSTARPRPDVRRWCSRRGAKHQAKAQGRPLHPGATGERQIGRVKYLNLWLMSRYGQPRRWDAAAGRRDWPQRSGRRRLGSALSREEHRRPRDTGGTHPGRSSCVRNAVTPVEVRCCVGR